MEMIISYAMKKMVTKMCECSAVWKVMLASACPYFCLCSSSLRL